MSGPAISREAKKRLVAIVTPTECLYCKREFTPENPRTIEHIIPWSRGGSKHPSNLGFTCLECNSSKGQMTGHEYLESLGRGGEPTRYGSHTDALKMKCVYNGTCSHCLGPMLVRSLNIRYCSEYCRMEQRPLHRNYKNIIFELAEYGLLV